MMMVKIKLLYYVNIVVTCVENVIVYYIITNVLITMNDMWNIAVGVTMTSIFLQMFKEAVKMDLHEGCGHIKLYWTISLADSCTLNGMVEFKLL